MGKNAFRKLCALKHVFVQNGKLRKNEDGTTTQLYNLYARKGV